MTQKKCMVYFNEEDPKHQKILNFMKEAGSKRASPAMIEMAYAGAILAEAGALRIFVDGYDHAGAEKALELLQVLRGSSTTQLQPVQTQQAISANANAPTPSTPPTKPSEPSKAYGHFTSPAKIFSD